MNVDYRISKETTLSFQDTLTKVREELKKEGFGVLTEINVKETLKKKLDVKYEDYIILGACNPPFAYEALKAEKEIGLLLPCNVIVYEKENNTMISAINPTRAMSIIENDSLKEIAVKIEEKLRKVIDSI